VFDLATQVAQSCLVQKELGCMSSILIKDSFTPVRDPKKRRMALRLWRGTCFLGVGGAEVAGAVDVHGIIDPAGDTRADEIAVG